MRTQKNSEPLEYDESYTKKCPKCRLTIPKASEYCPFCGFPIPTEKYKEQSNENERTDNKFQKEKGKGTSKTNVLIMIFVLAFLASLSFAFSKYKTSLEGKVQVPVDSTEVKESSFEELVEQLENAGFVNITKEQDETGWMEEGKTTKVTIDGVDNFHKDDYYSPNCDVVIYCSSGGRIDITNLLSGWKNMSCEDLRSQLTEAGFENISTQEEDTLIKEENKLVANIILNGEVYSEGECHLPKNTPITLSCYLLKINIRGKSSDYIGKNYKGVVSSLKERGFINIHLMRAENVKFLSFKKEGEIYSISIAGSSKFKRDDVFAYDEQIEIVVNTKEGEGCEDITDIAY